MVYVFDTSTLSVFGHYFPQRFPTFWQNVNSLVSDGRLVSTREVLNELSAGGNRQFILEWAKRNRTLFMVPSAGELKFVAEIFKIPHFQYLISEKQRLRGTPVADPFLIALAKVHGGCVVTEETFKENAARIPNICHHFDIQCTNSEGFMEMEEWAF